MIMAVIMGTGCVPNPLYNNGVDTLIETSPESAMLIFNMLDELATELGYVNGAQDLEFEEPCVNVELLQIVQERLIIQAEFRRQAALLVIQQAEEEIGRAYG
jgi:hypothetical protein